MASEAPGLLVTRTRRSRRPSQAKVTSGSRTIMTRTQLATLSLIALAACSGGGKSNSAIADSLSRDLNRPDAQASNALNDRPSAPAARAQAPKRKPRPKASAAPSPRMLAAGTLIPAEMTDSINSRHDKPGKTVSARVSSDVKDGA